MEENIGMNIKNELQDMYWQLIKTRADEYMNKQLTGKLIVDFQKGRINAIIDNSVIAGVSAVLFYQNKLLDTQT